MTNLSLRSMRWQPEVRQNEHLLTREWLVTNGLGGYASGTVSGIVTRRYHGLLISALPTPLGRTLMLAHVWEQLRLPNGTLVRLGGEETIGGVVTIHGAELLQGFHLEDGVPVWRYEVDGHVIEKRINMCHRQNTVHVLYKLVQGTGPIRLKLMPTVHFRSHDAPVNTPLPLPFRLVANEDKYEIQAGIDLPPLRLAWQGEHPCFTLESRFLRSRLYRTEESRGYESVGDLWSPGYFRADLTPERDVALIASTEAWNTIHAITPQEALHLERQRRERLVSLADSRAQHGLGAELVLAADQFLITPAARLEDSAWARAAGDEVQTVIAGYHWFTDWGRDTMISLEGLTLTTGRYAEAGRILRTFGHYVRDGLIPNLFPESQREGLYHTADGTLWFFHALERYLQYTVDRTTIDDLLPKLLDIVEHHIRGTRFGIHVDPHDGLLAQGAAGYQLTWMDAKVGDWVVTPRRGKAVEINALWYNALRILEQWLREREHREADRLRALAEQVQHSFNERFWNPTRNYLYDVIDGEQGNDDACRPNQLFAISLKHPVLHADYWEQVMNVVTDRLLTPLGLRSLAPGHPDYKPMYFGDLRSRDAAYHQGTVWAWLIGPFIDAWLKQHPHDHQTARKFLAGFEEHLGEACIGSISEVFDAEAPYWPRGCAAQAWSVAEVLRCWVKTSPSNSVPTQPAEVKSPT